MNVRTALISSALLLAVLGWACEQGPTSPSALGTPGGAAGGVSLDAAGGAIVGVKPDCADEGTHPSCKEQETEVPTYRIRVFGDICSLPTADCRLEGGPYNTNHHLGAVIVKDIFQMDISFFQNKVTCGGNPLPPVVVEARFSLTSFAIPQLLLFFEHNDVEHWIESLSDVGEDWVPTGIGQEVTVKDLNGQWEVRTRGKKNQNGCTGEGGGINWTATVELLPFV